MNSAAYPSQRENGEPGSPRCLLESRPRPMLSLQRLSPTHGFCQEPSTEYGDLGCVAGEDVPGAGGTTSPSPTPDGKQPKSQCSLKCINIFQPPSMLWKHAPPLNGVAGTSCAPSESQRHQGWQEGPCLCDSPRMRRFWAELLPLHGGGDSPGSTRNLWIDSRPFDSGAARRHRSGPVLVL